MELKAPTFVVAGAARAGSTAVTESLRHHPDILVTTPKEPHYLALGGAPPRFTGPDDDTTINRVTVTDEEAYLALFDGNGATARGEGSVSTLYYPEVAVPRLYRLNPDARIVLVLRDPVARAFSSHQYLLNRGSEPEPDFLRAVQQEETRKALGWHHLWHYTGMSRYADGVGHLLRAFGPDQVGVWWYDELTTDPVRCLTEIQSFVGVTPVPAEQLRNDRVNSSGKPRRRWLQNVMQAASRQPALRTVGKRLVPFDVRERIRRGNLVSNDVPGQARAELEGLFTDDLRRLEELLDRRVPSGWRGEGRLV
jgi:hypothetical protein